MMRYFVLLSLFIYLFTPLPAIAHDNVRIGVVNIVAIEQNSDAWQKKLVQLQEQFDRNREAIVAEEKTLKKQLEDYEKQRPLLSVEQQQEKEAEINQRVAAMQNKAAGLNGKLDQDSTVSRQSLRVKIAEIIDGLAKERTLDVIFEAGEENFSIVYYTERLDLTAQVITRLNKTYPSIKEQ